MLNAGYLEAATQIKESLLTNHWNTTYNCFQQGYNDSYKTLDVASWGVLFLLAIDEVERAESCLSYIEATFTWTEIVNINGNDQAVVAYKPNQSIDNVWSEGSLGVAMAYGRIGNFAKRDAILAEVEKMRGANGGIIYAWPASGDFSNRESVAGTAWMAMVSSGNADKFWGNHHEAYLPVIVR